MFDRRGPAVFMLVAVVIGVLVGLAASALVLGVQLIGDLVEKAANAGVGKLTPLLAAPIGLVVAWLVARRWGPGIEGDGVPETMVGLALRGGYLPVRTVGAKLAATVATLGFGGSAGREGPIVQIGGSIGSVLSRSTRFGEDQVRSLIAAGAGAGIGASFNAPIAGMLFALEVILGNFAIRHLNAVVVTSVAAAVTTRLVIGEERILSAPAHSVGSPAELAIYAVLGVLAGAIAVGFLRFLESPERVRERLRGWRRPLAAGVVVGLAGVVEPKVLGTGQEWVGSLLRLAAGTPEVWYTLVGLFALKILAVTVTLNGGGSGGAFMPSLFIGANLGAMVALLVQPVWGASTLQPGAFAVAGMAATFAGVARAPLTSIIIVFEITGDYGLVLPLMLAASLATMIAERYEPHSVYTAPLRRRGIHLPTREDVDLLDTVTVADVMYEPDTVCSPDATAAEAADLLERTHHHGIPVVERGRLVGIITLADLAGNGEPVAGQHVRDVMTTRPVTVSPSLPVSEALARMAALDVGRLPVVAGDRPDVLLGMFRRDSAVIAYERALGATTDRSLYRQRHQVRIAPATAFFEIWIPHGSPVTGRHVREVEWPDDVTLVSIRRGGSVLIPHGNTTVEPGDTVTAYGSGGARARMEHILGASGGGPQGSRSAP
jgi:CIC family chloride channel protein